MLQVQNYYYNKFTKNMNSCREYSQSLQQAEHFVKTAMHLKILVIADIYYHHFNWIVTSTLPFSTQNCGYWLPHILVMSFTSSVIAKLDDL